MLATKTYEVRSVQIKLGRLVRSYNHLRDCGTGDHLPRIPSSYVYNDVCELFIQGSQSLANAFSLFYECDCGDMPCLLTILVPTRSATLRICVYKTDIAVLSSQSHSQVSGGRGFPGTAFVAPNNNYHL